MIDSVIISTTHSAGTTAGRAADALRSILPPGLPTRISRSTDGRVDMEVSGVRLTVAWVGEGRSGTIREAIACPLETDSLLVIVGRRLPRAARAAAVDGGAGWIDESGAAFIMSPGLIIDRQAVERAAPAHAWTRATLAIAESVLLGSPATVSAVSAVTELSAGACAHGLRLLEDAAFLSSSMARGRDAGRVLSDADGLLGAYVETYRSFRRPDVLTCAVREPELWDRVRSAGAAWAAAGTRWAVTGVAGAHVVAPFLTSIGAAEIILDAKSPAELRAMSEAAGLHPAEGGRITLRSWTSPGTLVLAREVDGLMVAPWPTLYADALHVGVRGEDAAAHLLEVMNG